MKVHLTFDVEVWCNGWDHLDAQFPAAFERYCYGRSKAGDYALPRTLQILGENGLTGVFFIEPLFSLRFGERHLATMTQLILDAGHDVQLHLHPEWVDEIEPPLLEGPVHKRQHLSYYTGTEQERLLTVGRELLQRAAGREVWAFRSGSFAVNADSYAAMPQAGLLVDSSMNPFWNFSGGTLDYAGPFQTVRRIGPVTSYPVTVFTDGLGRQRPLQVGSCSLAEMKGALEAARDGGCRHAVVVSHNFEMLRPGSSVPDPVVVRRFEGLCAWLASRRNAFETAPFPRRPAEPASAPERRPAVSLAATAVRWAEQLARRVVAR